MKFCGTGADDVAFSINLMSIWWTALYKIGKSPAVEVGTEFVFTCPEGYYFEHDIYAPTKQKIRCTDAGTFKQPDEWFKCLARK